MITYQIDQETGNIKSWIKTPPFFQFQLNAAKDSDGEYMVELPVNQERPARGSKENSSYSSVELPVNQERSARSNAIGVPMKCPMAIRTSEKESWWWLPFEPIVTVNGKNIIVKKQVAKGKVRGSIKERWSQDDYQISINGIFINTTGTRAPEDDIQRLRRICESAKVEVYSPLLTLFSINKMVIESFDFPFTPGEQNQAYNISASSDEIYKLLLTGEDLKVQ